MVKPGHRGLKRLLWASAYSWQGILACWRYEAAFRQEVLACLVLTPVAFFIGADLGQVALLLIALGLVLLMEMVNSAIEALVDRVGPEHHDLSGRAKDIGSAVVALALLLAGLVWILVLIENWPW